MNIQRKFRAKIFGNFFARKILWNFTSLQQYRCITQRLAGKKRWCSLLRTKWISTTAFRDAVNKSESPPFAVCCDLSVTVRPQSHAKHKMRPTVIPLPTGERSIVMSVSVCLSVCPCLCVCVFVCCDHVLGTTNPIFKGGNVTSAGWQVTLCDPMWHVSSRSGDVATLRIAIHLLLTYFINRQPELFFPPAFAVQNTKYSRVFQSMCHCCFARLQPAVAAWFRYWLEAYVTPLRESYGIVQSMRFSFSCWRP